MTDQDKLAERSQIGNIAASALAEFSEINRARCDHFEGAADGFNISDFGNALAGEVGELCNVLKKYRRLELGIKMHQPPPNELHEKARDEIADVFIYLDLIATELGIDLVSAVAAKFNTDSFKHDAPYLIGVVKRMQLDDDEDDGEEDH